MEDDRHPVERKTNIGETGKRIVLLTTLVICGYAFYTHNILQSVALLTTLLALVLSYDIVYPFTYELKKRPPELVKYLKSKR